MVSSTYRDLEQHRAAAIRAIDGQGLHPVAMEQDSALPEVTVVDSSLQKVRDAAAYVGIVGRSYGQVPRIAGNPRGLSLTELEFREARRLGRPTLIFIMSERHPVPETAVELDPEKRRKLAEFRDEVKRASDDSLVHRVYREFDSLEDFTVAVTQSVAALRRVLDARDTGAAPGPAAGANRAGRRERDGIPAPPQLYAEPPYIGRQRFVGRVAQLETLTDWAALADPYPILLFDAIGGTGKSALTWEWVFGHATDVRGDWAGRFWYSFYEKGAVMADFCRRALAYTTGRPLDDFRNLKQPDLTDLLLRQLQSRPWLLVLDGLERVLVHYHRQDAAQLADEDAGTSDTIADRDPCAAIRPLDDELLRGLAAPGPSKILMTSRLVPSVLLGPAGQPIPGVRHEPLPGLRPADAEALLRSFGVDGDSGTIRTYLQRHCDCHPLVTGIVAGLVTHYLPARGQFDRWAADPDHGGRLDVSDLDLVGKRNHILHAAIDALPDPGRQLLSMLALLSEATDYDTINALNPHLPAEPDPVPAPSKPEDDWFWEHLSVEDRAAARVAHAAAIEEYQAYLQALRAWERSPERLSAARRLADAVADLEKRGLLQFDRRTRRYDLHPVVRSVAAGRLPTDDRDHLGQRVVDYFSARPHNPYGEAESLDDLQDGLTVVRTLLRMGRISEAYDAYRGDLADALSFNLEAHTETLSLLRPFFIHGWNTPFPGLIEVGQSYLASEAALALGQLGEYDQGLAASRVALGIYLDQQYWNDIYISLSNCAANLCNQNRLAPGERVFGLALELAEDLDEQTLFAGRLDAYRIYVATGRMDHAERMWEALDPMGRDWSRTMYRPGSAELLRARCLFEQGTLTADDLRQVEQIATAGRSRENVRGLYRLRGEWLADRGQWAAAADSLGEAVRMAREAGIPDAHAETLLALARLHLGQLTNPHADAERLAALRRPAHLHLARLWHAIGDTGQATRHALAAYRYAWADGEPHVHRHELNRATELLHTLGAEIPRLSPYDPAADPPPDWELRAAAAIRDLRRQDDSQG